MKFAYLLLAFFTFALSDNFSDGLNLYKNDANLSFVKFQSACDEKHFRACAMIGAMAYEGKGTAKNLNLAKENLKISCENGVMKSCLFLGEIYILGNLKSRNYTQSYKYLKIACENGIARACKSLSLNFNIPPQQKQKWHEMACEFGENLDCNKTNLPLNLTPISEQNSTSAITANQTQQKNTAQKTE